MKIFLIRHGEITGDPFVEPPRPVTGCLSEKGIRQAKRIHAYLKEKCLDTAFSSPFGRALQTAEIALSGKDVPIRILPGIREWMPNPKLNDLPSTEYEEILARNKDLSPENQWKTPLGEGCFDLYARVIPTCLAALGEEGIYPGCGGYLAIPGAEERSLAFFAHGGSLGILLSFLMGMRPFPLNPFCFEQGGLCEVSFEERNSVYYPTLTFQLPKLIS